MKRKFHYLISILYILLITPPLRTYSNSPQLLEEVNSKGEDLNNANLIESIFEKKNRQFLEDGYYHQFYEPSLQATYYAIKIIKSLEVLDQIDQKNLVSYIHDQYKQQSGLFLDPYALRYMKTEAIKRFYPLSSLLQVNCYALLSLSLLNELDSIDSQDFINFIWSCFNFESGGFIGEPFKLELPENLKVPTIDNTYYAVLTLDLLITDWTNYQNEKLKIIQYIENLQITDEKSSNYGGFLNDLEKSLDSLDMYEPNLISAYYCFKTLEIFQIPEILNYDAFNTYLDKLYTSYQFQISLYPEVDYYLGNVATSIALELSRLTKYNNFDRNQTQYKLVESGLQSGTWNASPYHNYHELIDSFQVFSPLNSLGFISDLNVSEKQLIFNGIMNYYQGSGFALLSKDYTSTKLMNVISESFSIYDKINSLNIMGIYKKLIKSCYYHPYFDSYIFLGSMQMDQAYVYFRSRPIEYYNYDEIYDVLTSHEATFYILNALKTLYKLDDFHTEFNLTRIINSIAMTQFLEGGFTNFGGYYPCIRYSIKNDGLLNSYVNIKASYFAIKTLNLILSHLNLDNFTDYILDVEALYKFVSNNIEETYDKIYYRYQDDVRKSVIYTYYMIYILKSIGLFNLEIDKITNYLLSILKYDDLEVLYFAYKIDELLGLELNFDIERSQELVSNLFLENYDEFLNSINSSYIAQETFLYVCEMAHKSKIHLQCDFKEDILLGQELKLKVLLGNIVLNGYSPYTVIKFENVLLGSLIFNKSITDYYFCQVYVPSDDSFYPLLTGYIRVYEANNLIKEKLITIRTHYYSDFDPFSLFGDFYFQNVLGFSLSLSTSLVSLMILFFVLKKMRIKKD